MMIAQASSDPLTAGRAAPTSGLPPIAAKESGHGLVHRRS